MVPLKSVGIYDIVGQASLDHQRVNIIEELAEQLPDADIVRRDGVQHVPPERTVCRAEEALLHLG